MAVTYTLAITDRYGMAVFSRASLAEGATSTIWADKYNELSTTKVEGALLRTPLVGPVTVTVTSSAATSGTFYVYVYYEDAGKTTCTPCIVTLAGTTSGSASSVHVFGYLIGVSCTVGAIPSPSESPSVSPSASPSNPGN